MDSRERKLIEECNSYDITVFYGMPNKIDNRDFYIYDLQSFLKYCELNEIKAVFFDCEYADNDENKAEYIKDLLEKYYKSCVRGYVEGVWRYPHIEASFYTPVLTKVLEQLNSDPDILTESDDSKDASDEIESIYVWAFHAGIRIYTNVNYVADGEEDENATIDSIYKKYQTLMREALTIRHKEAYSESKRIEQQKQQKVLDEIARIVKQEKLLGSMHTVKARNEYADEICVKWQIERGYEWLTKKAVRSIVELAYVSIKE